MTPEGKIRMSISIKGVPAGNPELLGIVLEEVDNAVTEESLGYEKYISLARLLDDLGFPEWSTRIRGVATDEQGHREAFISLRNQLTPVMERMY